jgi:hypothetical protein
MSSHYLNQSIIQDNVDVRCNNINSHASTCSGVALITNLSAVNSFKNAGFEEIIGKQSVTQTTSIIEPVTLNANAGVIVCYNSTANPLTSYFFKVSNNLKINADDIVTACVSAYTGVIGTNGLPVCNVSSTEPGAFHIVVTNQHASQQFLGVISISFKVTRFP